MSDQKSLDERIGAVTHEEAEQLALALIGKCFGNPERDGIRWHASIPVNPETLAELKAANRECRGRP